MDFCRLCGKCCYQTEMQLSPVDIQRIEKTNPFGFSQSEFTIRDGEDVLLKNVDGHCIFLEPDNNICQIYENRPRGCQFYPLIYDMEKDQCVRDELCPHKAKFYKKKPLFQRTCRELKNWVHTELFKDNF